jgi:putative ABC transport system permease protein
MPDARRVYRLFIRLYPARFREEYAAPLERQFADDYRDALAGGGLALFLLRVATDLLFSIPKEFVREAALDLRYAARVYRRRLLVTGLALAALALGIGAATGVFSVLNAVLLRSLPFRDAGRLVELQGAGMGSRAAFFQRQSASAFLSDAAVFSTAEMNLDLGGESMRTKIAETSAGFFRVLGLEPVFGRSFTSDEDLQGHDAVAIIGYGLWQQFFAGNPSALGKTVVLNGTPLTVIGVAPPSFDYPGRTAIWIPTVFDFQKVPKFGVIFWRTLGRLKAGMTLARANSMFLAGLPPGSIPEPGRKSPSGFSPVTKLIPLRDQLAGPVRQASLILLAMVIFVLMIACANVAHLLLSRFTERRQELTIRAALGASRARLMQQLVTESTLLTLAASALGLGIARWAASLAAKAQPAPLESQSYTVLDLRVLAFVVALAALTGIVFGVLPALLMGRTQPSADPLRSQTGAEGRTMNRVRSGLIAMQAALTLALVAGSFLMGRTFLGLLGTDLGFRTDHAVTLNVSLSGTRYENNHGQAEYYRQALDRLRAIPGVQAVAAAQFLPLVETIYMGQEFSLDPTHKAPLTLTLPVTPDYFRTLGTPVLDGREFSPIDGFGSDPVVIVNRTLANQLYAGQRVVGRKVSDQRGEKQYTIVGVVADERVAGPSAQPQALAYFPMDQWPASFVTFVARVRGSTEAYLALCRDALRQLDPHVPVYDVKTLDQRLSDNLKQPRFYSTVILFFGGFALLLALIGVYGVATHSIAQRAHEIGVRLAVGARFAQVRLMLMRQSLLPLIVGLGIGVAGSFALRGTLQALIYNAPALDGLTCGGAALLLALAAAIAVWFATRRILKLDPMRTLRSE